MIVIETRALAHGVAVIMYIICSPRCDFAELTHIYVYPVSLLTQKYGLFSAMTQSKL